ncbi:hypothetical protein PSWA111526_08200 [Pseudomonas wadenswilerensis]|uniref:Transmembrane protein n=2 Tax=Pseudomonas wadenswilerensis TaxID=1785161 RepID=A0A380T5J0_9PSED|nr:hypothetical protein CCOS864_04330 [Pseudomonas wadenswilerensis]
MLGILFCSKSEWCMSDSWLSLFRGKTVYEQIRVLLGMAGVFLLMGLTFLLFVQSFDEPGDDAPTLFKGQIVSAPTEMRQDSSTVYFQVRLTEANPRPSSKQIVYVSKELYQAAGLAPGVMVDVFASGGVDELKIREVLNSDGRVVFDERFDRRITSVKNHDLIRYFSYFMMMTLICCSFAGVLWFRQTLLLRASR